MSQDITTLREQLFATLAGVKDGSIDIDRARAVNEGQPAARHHGAHGSSAEVSERYNAELTGGTPSAPAQG